MALMTDVKAAPKGPAAVVTKTKGITRDSKSKKTRNGNASPPVSPEPERVEDLHKTCGSVVIKLATETEPIKINLFSGPTLKQYSWLQHANNALCVAEYTSVKKVADVEDRFFFHIERSLEEFEEGMRTEKLTLISSLRRKINNSKELLVKELERLKEI